MHNSYLWLLMFVILFASCDKEQHVEQVNNERVSRVLVLTETQGFRHESIDAGINMFTSHALEWGIEVTYSGCSEDYLLNAINRFDIIVLLNTTGDYLNQEEQQEVKEYLQDGGAILGIHAAADAEYNWDWYRYILGGWFDSHPEIQSANCMVDSLKMPLTNGLPVVWTRTDEWYNFKNLMPDNQITVTIDEGSYVGGTNGSLHPISWYRLVENGKVFYTAMGHTKESYKEPLFILQIKNAIEWLKDE